MLHNHRLDSSCVLVGASIHNQRNERLWRDVFVAVTQLFDCLFYYMECCKLLNVLSTIDLFALNFVFETWINQALNLFIIGWNSHAISKNAGKSPLKLFTKGMIQHQISNKSIKEQDHSSTLSEVELGVDEDEDNGVNVSIPGSNGIVIPLLILDWQGTVSIVLRALLTLYLKMNNLVLT